MIYKTTNLINGKEYIGKHQTKVLEDGYLGSGNHLKRAIKIHGIENFKREILFTFDVEADMNVKEAELVTEEYCARKDTYNICPGGKGGFGYVNTLISSEERSARGKAGSVRFQKRFNTDLPFRETIRKQRQKYDRTNLLKAAEKYRIECGSYWLGKKHKPETIEKMKESFKGKQAGSKNSQFGSCWITNGTTNKKIKKTDLDKYQNLGYNLGRVVK